MKILNFPDAGARAKKSNASKEYRRCKLEENIFIDHDIYRLNFSWQGPAPQAGQFFMIKPERGSVFLGRPISAAAWEPSKERVEFLIAARGPGTIELVNMYKGEYAELTGPLGNTWMKFISPALAAGYPIALIGGGIGIAPLRALAAELPDHSFDFYAGFRTGFADDDRRQDMLGAADAGLSPRGKSHLIIATEDGSEGYTGRIPDFLEPEKYAAVCACGPAPMLRAIAGMCKAARVPCLVSMEQYMACGVGACLGCTIKTIHGNKRCCADGPIFPAEELFLNE